jgi:hypothetical protein
MKVTNDLTIDERSELDAHVTLEGDQAQLSDEDRTSKEIRTSDAHFAVI